MPGDACAGRSPGTEYSLHCLVDRGHRASQFVGVRHEKLKRRHAGRYWQDQGLLRALQRALFRLQRWRHAGERWKWLKGRLHPSGTVPVVPVAVTVETRSVQGTKQTNKEGRSNQQEVRCRIGRVNACVRATARKRICNTASMMQDRNHFLTLHNMKV